MNGLPSSEVTWCHWPRPSAERAGYYCYIGGRLPGRDPRLITDDWDELAEHPCFQRHGGDVHWIGAHFHCDHCGRGLYRPGVATQLAPVTPYVVEPPRMRDRALDDATALWTARPRDSAWSTRHHHNRIGHTPHAGGSVSLRRYRLGY